MLVIPDNYDQQGLRNKDRRKHHFHRWSKGPTVTHENKSFPKVSTTYGKLNRYTLLLVNISYLRSSFEADCVDAMREHQLDIIHQEALYDYLVMHSFSDAVKELDYRVTVAGLYRHDIYDLIYADFKAVWVKAMKVLIKNQNVTFLVNDTPKIMVTGETMMLARSFNAVI